MFTFLRKTLHRYLLDRLLVQYRTLYTGEILDIGAGSRRYQHLYQGHVTSVDIQPISPVIFGDVTQLTFSDATFDTVLCIEVLEYVGERYTEALDQIVRVLRPGGQAIISVPFYYHDHGDSVRLTRKQFQVILSLRFSHVTIISFGNQCTSRWDNRLHNILKTSKYFKKIVLLVWSLPLWFSGYIQKNKKDDCYTGIFAIVTK